MIKSIKLTNFFSFRDEKIDFHPEVNLMVGVNGSGKSNLIKAIRLLKTGVEGSARGRLLQDLIVGKWGGFDNIFWKGSVKNEKLDAFQLEFKFDGKALSEFGTFVFDSDVIYEIVFNRKGDLDNYYLSESIRTESGISYLDFVNGFGRVMEFANSAEASFRDLEDSASELAISRISEFDRDRVLPLFQLKMAIQDISIYTHFDTTEGSGLRRSMSATSSERKLLPDGSNLPQILNTINIKHKESYRRILAMLKEVNEAFTGIDFHFLGSGTFELLLEESGLKSSIHVTHVSDGTLRYLCLLAILLNPERGRFVCIDEPEVGLHPDMIHGITSVIQEVMEETTFLIATHSENVLNGFRVENIRVFEKNETNSTVVKQFAEEDFAGWYDDFSPGIMWRAGDLGGNRW